MVYFSFRPFLKNQIENGRPRFLSLFYKSAYFLLGFNGRVDKEKRKEYTPLAPQLSFLFLLGG